MRLTNQKTLAGKLFKCSPKRIKINPERLADVKEAVTRQDIRVLVADGLIVKQQSKGHSMVRARIRMVQKRKGRQRGQGARKGKFTARAGKKIVWVNKIRAQRGLLKELKSSKRISVPTYRDMLGKAKGGFFRSRRHINLYLEERGLFENKV